MNKLIIIGHMGDHVCYLNISEDEAISRFIEEYNWYSLEEVKDMTRTLEFKDTFQAYDIEKYEN